MFSYSKHFLNQIKFRNIAIEEAEDILKNPDQINIEDGLKVYQRIFNNKQTRYMLRIFVNDEKQPAVVVTAYKTTKINKYSLP